MPRKLKEHHALVKKIVDQTFHKEVNTVKVQEIKEDMIKYFYNKYGNDTVSASFQFDDAEVSHWRKDEHFVKLFYFELKHAEKHYDLTRGERHFIMDISEFLMWELNILVDDSDKPLNQTNLSEKLGLHPKTVRENMKSLEVKNIIHKIEMHKEVFYIVNPYIVYKGKNINVNLPMLFDELGYVNSNMTNDSRSHRRKEQKKRLKI